MLRNIHGKIMLFFTVCTTATFLFTYGTNNITFYGDALGYYVYLPSTTIYHNLKTPYALPADNGIAPYVTGYLNDMRHQSTTSRGYFLNQYTYGVALMESPFFFIAHAYEKASGARANGFSAAYSYLVKAGNLIYAILGLLLVYKVLKRYFTPAASMVSTCCIFLCTNLFYFSTYQAGMSHVILFFLYALVVYLSIKIQERPTSGLFLITGLTTGIITLIRPTDILCLLIPLLYGVYNKDSLKKKALFIKAQRIKILLAAAAFILPIIPQLFYWKAVTGHYVCYSYGNQSFNWLRPKIIEGLFYFSNGWLPYSPVMVFALVGLLCYRKIKNWALCLCVIIPVYIYIIYSWWCYNYINGLGSRPMIHLYPLLAIPLTAFIALIQGQRLVVKVFFGALALLFVFLNVAFSRLQAKGMLDSEESNMAYNYEILFRSNLRYEDLLARDFAAWQPDTSKLEKTGTLMCQYFDDSLSQNYLRDTAGGNKYIYHMNTEEYGDIATATYDKEKSGGASWFKVSGRFMYPEPPDYFKHILVLDVKDKLEKYFRIENKIYDTPPPPGTITLEHSETNKWGHPYFYIRIPESLKTGDEIKMFIWNTGKRPLYMDSVCLELYRYK